MNWDRAGWFKGVSDIEPLIDETFLSLALHNGFCILPRDMVPCGLYSSTKSVFLLGLATTVYNATNGLGSYLWGDIIDRTHRRTEFVIAIPTMLSLSVLLLEGNLQEGLIGYGLVGFSSSLSSPLYSVILLENYDFEEVPRINSRLSQLNLAGNVTGSLAAGLLGDVKFPLISSTLDY